MEKPENQNQQLEPMAVAKPGKPCVFMGMGAGLAHQEAVGRVFGRVWN